MRVPTTEEPCGGRSVDRSSGEREYSRETCSSDRGVCGSGEIQVRTGVAQGVGRDTGKRPSKAQSQEAMVRPRT